MNDDPALDFATMLCSRLCHDLISPMGAVGNGVELMQATGGGDPEDLALVADGAAAAQAALTFYRIAFGAADPEGRRLSLRELGSIASDQFQRSRLRLDWPQAADELSRPAARLLLLTLMAAALAAPLGGVAAVAAPRGEPTALEVRVEGRRAAMAPEAEEVLTGRLATAPSGREAALALAARCAAALGARYAVEQGDGVVTIRTRAA